MKDIFNSFLNNRIEKVRTHFFWSYTIWFIAYNWQLFFSVFNFDEQLKLDDKIDIIRKCLDLRPYYDRFGTPIIASFCSIILFHLLNTGALSIAEIVRTRIVPYLRNKISKGASVVEKTRYDSLFIKYQDLAEKNDVLIRQKTDHTAERVEWEKVKETNQNNIQAISQLEESIREKDNVLNIHISEKQAALSIIRSNLDQFVFSDYPGVSLTQSPLLLSSAFIFFRQFTIMFWVKLEHKKLLGKKINNLYIIGHDTNKGKDVQTGAESRYRNAFGISFSPDSYQENTSRLFLRFWCTNNSGNSTDHKVDVSDVEEGWHLVTLTWSRQDRLLKMYINEELIIEDNQKAAETWPEYVAEKVFISNWPNLHQAHFMPFQLYNLSVTAGLITIDQISIAASTKPDDILK